ncbi:MAG: hypothetical protein GWO78_05230 [Dehalococcoidales bacterium]|jgi:hypothetical protein|nr:hypothetical protein [Dehalococcoidia bacterium]NCG35374.1 hypothetical protein [Dehalococcoidales bacterium]
MAKKIKKSKKITKPNVFKQNSSGSTLPNTSNSNPGSSKENTTVTNTQKSNINNFVSESLVSFELKKIAIITAAIFIILIILTFLLG